MYLFQGYLSIPRLTRCCVEVTETAKWAQTNGTDGRLLVSRGTASGTGEKSVESLERTHLEVVCSIVRDQAPPHIDANRRSPTTLCGHKRRNFVYPPVWVDERVYLARFSPDLRHHAFSPSFETENLDSVCRGHPTWTASSASTTLADACSSRQDFPDDDWMALSSRLIVRWCTAICMHTPDTVFASPDRYGFGWAGAPQGRLGAFLRDNDNRSFPYHRETFQSHTSWFWGQDFLSREYKE